MSKAVDKLFDSGVAGSSTSASGGAAAPGGGAAGAAGDGGGLASLLQNDRGAFEALSATVGKNIPAPGYMAVDQANVYMSRIRGLFPGVPGNEVEMALAVWIILHDVGGTQDFADKPPIIAGGHSVSASRIFGEVIPADKRGLPRQFGTTMFESVVRPLLDMRPELRAALRPRALELGLPPGCEDKVVSIVRGGKPGCTESSSMRAIARGRAIGASTTPIRAQPRPVQVEQKEPVQPVTQHDLY